MHLKTQVPQGSSLLHLRAIRNPARPIGWLLSILLCATSCARAAEISVGAGELQRAINDARPGDTLVLAAGSVYTGNFVLPNKGDATEYITIKSSETAALPRNVRLKLDQVPKLATIVTPNTQPAIDAAEGAHHYRFIGIEVRPAEGIYVYDLVRLGVTPKELAAVPHDFVFDRVYIHGDPDKGSKRGIALNCATALIENSYLSDFKSPDQDTQAIAGWSGPGPFTITNNYLEASGENILFGDPQPGIPGLVPSDIVIKGNYLFKPLSWKPGTDSYAGKKWMVKNLFELKSAQRVTLSGNVLENSWASGQVGFAIVLTVRTQGGLNPTAVVKDVTIRDNLIRHAGHGVSVLGVDTNGQGQTSGIVFANNVFEDISGATWSTGPGRLFQIINKAQDITIEHNTALPDGSIILADEGATSGLVFQNNIVAAGLYGVVGGGTAAGLSSLNRYFPGYVFQGNVVIGASSSQYPPGNQFPKSIADVGFLDVASNLALAPASPFAASADASAPGADCVALQPVFSAALSGTRAASAPVTRPPARAPVTGRNR